MSWRKVEIKDVCIGIYDGPHATPPPSKTGAIFLGISNFINGQLDLSDIRYIAESDLPKWTKRVIPQPKDIVFSYEATLNLYAIIPDGFRGCLGRRMALLRIDESKAYYKFLYYYFYSDAWRAIIKQHTVLGATVDRIPLIKFPNFKIELPPLELQHCIADILSAYDDLIENNQKQIKLLEEAAQRLYKEWFVELHFPGYKNILVVDGVPEGWKRASVGSLIGKVDRTKQIKTSDYKRSGSIPIIDQSRDFIAGYTDDREALVEVSSPIIVFGDHTRILKLIQFPFAKGADGTQLIVTKCRNMPQRLLYCSLVNVDLSNYHYARHFKYLKAEEILVPTTEISNKFETFATDIFSQIQNCRDQILQAQLARDFLLPKLMSGKVGV